jgi:RNA polymerase sigma-70 factor (sigma-E family)
VDGDDGFRDFVVAATPALSRSAYLLTGDHQLAEDLLQSALANTYRHWRRVRDGNPRAYVRRAMVHEHTSWWRRGRASERLSPDPPPGRDRADDPADRTAARLTLAAALARLTPRQRAVIVLRYYDDQTEAETARLLGCTVGTVKRHAHEALARLRTLAPHLLADTEEVTA